MLSLSFFPNFGQGPCAKIAGKSPDIPPAWDLSLLAKCQKLPHHPMQILVIFKTEGTVLGKASWIQFYEFGFNSWFFGIIYQ